MIYILEGANGVGKGAYAKLLSECLGVPIVRPFRNSTDYHWNADPSGETTAYQAQLVRLGVPVNTHVDDLYVADFLSTFTVGAILDRSVPSAVAYGILHGHRDGWYEVASNVTDLLKFWQAKLVRVPTLYVWLRAPYKVAKERATGWLPNKRQFNRLEGAFERCFMRIKLPKRQINTTEVAVEDGVVSILRTSHADVG